MSVRLMVLGPVEVETDGRPADGLAPRHRALLAYLLLHTRTVLTPDQLADALWGLTPPTTARSQIHHALSAIRKVLRTAGCEHILLTRHGGYTIQPDPGIFDLDLFTTHVADAQRALAAGNPMSAVAQLRSALALWRGQALADLKADYIDSARTRLHESRLRAVEQLADVELTAGRHTELIEELAGYVAAEPLREKLTGQFMLALHRSGHQAEALTVARSLRTRLIEDHGLDPSPAFTELEQAILRRDPSLDPPIRLTAPRPPHTDSAPLISRPDHIPAEAPHFVGRAIELEQMNEWLRATGSDAGILAVDGMAGVGKTALAIRLAHSAARHFRDGALFIDLFGHTPAQRPIDASAALEMLLRQLGIADEHIPEAVHARAMLWRRTLSRRHVLVVLDNAADARQIQPLLTRSESSRIIVTSRHRLIDLDGPQVLSMGLLSASEAHELFSALVGPRAAAEPRAVSEVVMLCGRLPLAIRIAAARLVHRPRWTVDHLAQRLSGGPGRLGVLTTAERGVASAFSLSYAQLVADEQRMFRLLGSYPAVDIGVDAAAALVDLPRGDVAELLERLLDAHMLTQQRPGRYSMHDLLRDYARAVTAEEDPSWVRAEAQERAFSHYLRVATAAVEALYPGGTQTETPRPPTYRFDNPVHALEWLAAERANLLALASGAEHLDCTGYAVRLARLLHPYLHGNGHCDDPLTLHSLALPKALDSGERIAQSPTRSDLAYINWRYGRLDQEHDHARRAAEPAASTGAPRARARAEYVLDHDCSQRDPDQAA